MGETKDRKSGYIYKDMPYNAFWNIVFLNTNTNEIHVLTDKKILIQKYDYKYYREGSITVSKNMDFIFYEARYVDFNNDRVLSEDDPLYLFISDKTGKHFKQISPENYSIENWGYIEKSDKIIFNAKKDSNKNLKFDDEDEVSTFEFALNKSEIPVEVFDEIFKMNLKSLYDKDWKRISE